MIDYQTKCQQTEKQKQNKKSKENCSMLIVNIWLLLSVIANDHWKAKKKEKKTKLKQRKRNKTRFELFADGMFCLRFQYV